MSPEQSKLKALESIESVRSAKTHLSRAMDQCADLPGWSNIHREVIRQYDVLGALLSSMLGVPPVQPRGSI
jgi:hypothetical protein